MPPEETVNQKKQFLTMSSPTSFQLSVVKNKRFSEEKKIGYFHSSIL